MNAPYGIFPAQCECGHLFLEKYQFKAVQENGIIGFCWCGFCRTRVNVYPHIEAEQLAQDDRDEHR